MKFPSRLSHSEKNNPVSQTVLDKYEQEHSIHKVVICDQLFQTLEKAFAQLEKVQETMMPLKGVRQLSQITKEQLAQTLTELEQYQLALENAEQTAMHQHNFDHETYLKMRDYSWLILQIKEKQMLLLENLTSFFEL